MNILLKFWMRQIYFCLPSDSEGFPTSVLEAVACKCFVITTYQGGAKELLVDEQYGIIMRDNTVESIQKNLEKVIEDDAYRTQAECKSYDRLVKYFTWDATAEKVMQIAKRHEWGERMKVLIIIPAYNEQDNIERVVKHLTEKLSRV